jgi:hypothetical protein
MKWTIPFILIVTLLAQGCKSGAEELASFDGGKVLRKDMREFYAFREIPSNENATSVKTQSSIVENIAVQSIVEIELEKKKLHETPVFQKAMELSEVQLASNLYRKNFIEKFKAKQKLDLAHVQFLMVGSSSTEQSSGQEDQKDKDEANKHLEALNALKADKEIFAYISENTKEEQRKPLGGYFEPICANCQDDTFVPVFKEGLDSGDKKFRIGKFSDKLFVYRVASRKSVSADDLEKAVIKRYTEFRDMALEFQNKASSDAEKELARYYAEEEPALGNKSKMYAQRILQSFEQKAWEEEHAKVKTDMGFKMSDILNSPALDFSKLEPETVLFETKSGGFTVKDLNTEYEALLTLRGNTQGSPDSEKLNYLQSISIPRAVLLASEEGAKVKKSDKYASHLALLRKNVAWNIYLMDMQKGIEVSEDEIKTTYEMGKNFAYSEEVPGKAGQKRPLSFDSVKDRIKQEVQENKFKSMMDDQIKKLKEDYHVTFFPEKLKAGEI